MSIPITGRGNEAQPGLSIVEQVEILGDLTYQMGMAESRAIEGERLLELERRRKEERRREEDRSAETRRLAELEIAWTPTPEAEEEGVVYSMVLDTLMSGTQDGRKYIDEYRDRAGRMKGLWIQSCQLLSESNYERRVRGSLIGSALSGAGASVLAYNLNAESMEYMGIMFGALFGLSGWAVLMDGYERRIGIRREKTKEEVKKDEEGFMFLAFSTLCLVAGPLIPILTGNITVRHGVLLIALLLGTEIGSVLASFGIYLGIKPKYEELQWTPALLTIARDKIKALGDQFRVDVSRILGS